jgi:hypothetical protein
MNISLMQFFTAIAMVGTAIALFFIYRKYLATNSERRMLGMLEAVGLDRSLATEGDTQTIMNAVRHRCRSCASEDVCERWLRDEKKGDNAFCPNSKVFAMLKIRSSVAA